MAGDVGAGEFGFAFEEEKVRGEVFGVILDSCGDSLGEGEILSLGFVVDAVEGFWVADEVVDDRGEDDEKSNEKPGVKVVPAKVETVL